MAETRTVLIDVQVEGSDVSAGLKRVDNQLDNTKDRVKALKAETDKTSRAMSNGFRSASDAAAIIPGPIGQAATAMGGLTKGANMVKMAFHTWKAALISTGIGAFIVAIGTLIAYFTETEKGAQKLRVGMAALGAVVRSYIDAWIGMAQALKSFLTLDISGGINKIKSSFTSMTTGMVENTKAAMANAEALNKVEEAEGDLTVKRAEANKEIAKARLIADDLTKSTEERIAAVQKAGAIEEEVAREELQIAAMKLKALDDNMKRKADASEEDRDEVDAAKVRLADLERETIMRQKRLGSEVQGLKNEAAAADKERNAEHLAAEKERNDAELQLAKELEAEKQAIADSEFKIAEAKAANELRIEEYMAERKAVTAEEQLALDIERALAAEEAKFQAVIMAMSAQQATIAEVDAANLLYEEEQMRLRNDLQSAYDQKQLQQTQESEDAITKAKREAQEKRLADEKKAGESRMIIARSISSSLSSISSMIQEEGKGAMAAKKVLAVAQIAIDTAMAISAGIAGATTAATATGPGAFVATPVFIATTIATVLGAMASATAVLASTPGGAPSLPSASSVTSMASTPPQIAPVTTNTTQLGNTEQAELMPIQAFVVETQITGSQNNINQIESQATFGNPE